MPIENNLTMPVKLFRSGDLDLIQLHLMSMQQVQPLIAKVAQAQIDAPEAAAEPVPAAVN